MPIRISHKKCPFVKRQGDVIAAHAEGIDDMAGNTSCRPARKPALASSEGRRDDPVNLPAIPFFRRQRVEHVEILMAAVDDMSRQ